MAPLTPALLRLIGVLDQAVRLLGRDLTITCGRDGHQAADPHSRGMAVDVRTRDLPEATILTLHLRLREWLGPLWTVLYEVPTKPTGVLASIAYVNPEASAAHLHLQPKKGTEWPS